AESLNASVAAGIALYEVARLRAGLSRGPGAEGVTVAGDEPGGPASAGDGVGPASARDGNARDSDARDSTDAARAALAERLRVSARASPVGLAASREVPRPLFRPDLPAEQAYQDEAFVVKSDASGLPLSSSSQPAMMAIMLEQLGLQPGHRVLEIGTGTGYNA